MKKSGFTLVEIMIVVAVLGLIAAFAISAVWKNRKRGEEKLQIRWLTA